MEPIASPATTALMKTLTTLPDPGISAMLRGLYGNVGGPACVGLAHVAHGRRVLAREPIVVCGGEVVSDPLPTLTMDTLDCSLDRGSTDRVILLDRVLHDLQRDEAALDEVEVVDGCVSGDGFILVHQVHDGGRPCLRC